MMPENNVELTVTENRKILKYAEGAVPGDR